MAPGRRVEPGERTGIGRCVRARPGRHGRGGDLRVELHAPGRPAQPERLQAGRRPGERHGARREPEPVRVPLQDDRVRIEPAEERVVRGGGAQGDGMPAVLRDGRRPDLAAQDARQQLCAQAHAEDRHAVAEQRPDRVALGREPRVLGVGVRVHAAPEDDRGVRLRHGALRLAAGERAHDEIVAALAHLVAHDARARVVLVHEGEDPQRPAVHPAMMTGIVRGMGHDDTFKAFEADTWADRAATYDLVTGAVTAQVTGPLLDLARVSAGTEVLDVGCGPGVVAAAAAARGAKATGVDLAEAMVGLARERHPGIAFAVGDAEALPFADGAFEAVVAGFLINHVPAPERALAECARVLAPGGRLALALWAPSDDNPLLGELSHAVTDAGVDVREGLPPGPDPYQLAAADEMRRALEAVGLRDVEQETLRLVHRATGAEELWTGLMGGSARVSTVIARQDRAVQERVRDAFAARVAAYAEGDGIALPATVRLAGAGRPAPG